LTGGGNSYVNRGTKKKKVEAASNRCRKRGLAGGIGKRACAESRGTKKGRAIWIFGKKEKRIGEGRGS